MASQQADFLRHIRNIVKNAGTYTGELKFLDGLAASSEEPAATTPCVKCNGQDGWYIAEGTFNGPSNAKWVACDACSAYATWTPTPDRINALPGPVRKYIHDLVTRCDPAGIVAENTLLRDQTKCLDAMIGRLKSDLEQATNGKPDRIIVEGGTVIFTGELLQGQKEPRSRADESI